MSLYMCRFGYRPEVWAALIKSPENREETVRRMLEGSGCTLHKIWYAFGDQDGFALIEAPDNVRAASVAIAISSSGAFTRFETTPVMTQEETLEALRAAAEVGYTPAGTGVHA
jgi:uncharacterized protein with GYD domain